MPNRTLTLLNADDDDANRYAVSRVLKKAGYVVQEATTGEEAWRMAQARPSLILLDVKLPDISGFEVCRRIKADPVLKSIPVLHLSASFISSADRAQGLSGGADGYLIKPVDPVELLATISSLLRMRLAEELATANAREWNATFDAISDGVCLLDREGKVRLGNPAFAELLQTPVAQLTGRPLETLIHHALGVDALPTLADVQQARERISLEVDAGSRSFRITADPVFGTEGTPTGAVYIFADISERRRMQREQQQRQEEIQELNTRLKRAMAETHHRVKNNLQVISALVDMQVMENLEQVPLSEWKRLGMHIRTLAAVHDLLTATVRNNQEADAVSVEAALDRLLPMVQSTLGTRQLKAQVQDIMLPARLLGSLTILINEIVSNAVKHGRGDIELTFMSVTPGKAQLEVCDDGPGFPPDFNPRHAANTGLELIDSTGRHDLQGEIAFTNRAEGGARVIVTMPLPEEVES